MSTHDQSVTLQTIKSVHGAMCRRGPKPMLNDLAEEEPALAAYVIQSAAAIASLANVTKPKSLPALVQREVTARMLVALQSLRRAHYERWCDAMEIEATPQTEGDSDGQ